VKFLWSIFAGVGGLFLAAALVLLALDLRFFADARRTEGVVVSLRCGKKGSCAPDIAYSDHAGRRHTLHSNRYARPSYQVGDRLPLAYDPDEPDDAAVDRPLDRHLLPALFGGIGGIQFTIGLLGLLRRARRKREIAWLLRAGERVEATVVTITHDTSIRVNRRHPWVIHCEARLPGEATPRKFISRRFWDDPTPHVGRTLVVRYDPRDPGRHVVDTGELQARGESARQS
jgi:hypothetical protein